MTTTTSSPPRPTLLLFAAIFLGSFLNFAVQPLIGKYLVPWFGGTTAVWTTCMLFFQICLLAGYLYAHLATRFLPPRLMILLHVILLAASFLTLPIIPADYWKPTDDAFPPIRILLLLSATIGFPYFVLAASSPLLQKWLVLLAPDYKPYRLFALSNVASLLALLSYPLLIEPFLTRRQQALGWSAGLILYALLATLAALLLWKKAPAKICKPKSPISNHKSDILNPKSNTPTLFLWLLLPASASALFLGGTNALCQDLVSVPFLWILPLMLYLISFIIAFDSPRWYHRKLYFAALAFLLAILFTFKLNSTLNGQFIAPPLILLISLICLIVLLGCTLCHAELANLKPDTTHLTAFYLAIAVGGVIGGLAVALAAPILFNSMLEFPAAILSSMALVLLLCTDSESRNHRAWMFGSTALAAFYLILSLYIDPLSNMIPVERHRNFYGMLTIYRGNALNPLRPNDPSLPLEPALYLLNGSTLHGFEFLEPSLRHVPTGYYRPASGIGRLMTCYANRPKRVGLVGLGAGTLAAYGRPGDSFRFYELNPLDADLAISRFAYIHDAQGHLDIVLGDGRLSLEREAPQHYDILVLDAFSSDSIPIHLLTTEALHIYQKHLNPDGVLAIHITNRYFALYSVVNAMAAEAHAHIAFIPDGSLKEGVASEWALITTNPTLLEQPPIARATDTRPLIPNFTPWTDDYATLLPLLR